MKIKDISVCMASPEGDRAAFAFARAFAQVRDAHLSCAAFTILPQIIVGYGDATGAELYAMAIQETREQMNARHADLVIVQAPCSKDRQPRSFPRPA